MALPKNFEGLVNTLMYRPSLPTASELTVILIQDDQRRDIKENKNEGEVLLTKGGYKKPLTQRKEGGQKSSKKVDGECHYCGSDDHMMKTCPDLAAELKKRKAERMERSAASQSVNLIDNFGDDDDFNSDSKEEPDRDTELAVNFTEVNLADHRKSSSIDD